jgi:hypothetical protein
MLSSRNTLASANAAVTASVPEGAPARDWLEKTALGMAEGFVVNVTPAMAAAWLKTNTVNRRFRQAHARTLAAEMISGQWRLTHQGIAFGKSGRLVDGQHRLDAIVQAGKPQPLLLFIDEPEEGFANYDRGAKRDMSDILLKDQRYVSIANAVVNLCVSLGGKGGRRAMLSEVESVLRTYGPDIEAQMALTSQARAGRTIAPIRAAWVVHHHDASEPDQRRMKIQWRAFVEMDPKRMDTSTASGVQRIDRLGRKLGGGTVAREAACIGWLMFDPARRDLERIVIKNTSTTLDELRAAVRARIPELVHDGGAAVAAKRSVMVKKPPHGGNEKPVRIYPFADPVKGPFLRAKALATIAAKRAIA